MNIMTSPQQAFLFDLPAQPSASIIPTASAIPTTAGGLSPVMAQYCQIKEDYPGSLLFFRMGDFYELFFEDAVIAARDLNITLTKRGKQDGTDIPMCGVPVHTCEAYLAKLIRMNHKVAICEQIEDPETAKKRGSKGPLKRDVVRLVTAGTLTEDGLLQASQHNFLVALSPVTQKMVGVAVIDLSTGSFLIEETDLNGVPAVLARLRPAEILIPDRLMEDPNLYEHLNLWKRQLTPMPQARFDARNGRDRLETIYNVHTLDGFGKFSEAQIRAAGALVDYIHLTQKSALKLLDRPRLIVSQSLMMIDPATRRSLELVYTLSGQRSGSLLDTIDRTMTAAGGRLLSLQLSAPLTQPAPINQRLDKVAFFVESPGQTQNIRELLKECPDIERSLSRVNFNRAGPRDLAAIRQGLSQSQLIQAILEQQAIPVGLQRDCQKLGHHLTLIDRLNRALADTLPIHARDGDFIAPGYHDGLDTFRELRDNGRDFAAQLQQKYSVLSGIPSLKVKHNNILGYHIDITPSYASKVPDDFIHRQTLASSIRYTTVELSELENRIEAATRQTLELELQLFADLVHDIQGHAAAILDTCRALARIDVTTALATLAIEGGYCRPLIDDSLMFEIEAGQHPVVAHALSQQDNKPFVGNSCLLNDDTKLLLLTGPNMAGKSTYLRQNALIAIMAQMGSYVPASHAHIGVIDRIFSRVGAADDLASGRSTFMVEMIEAAAILHQATERSFVILDELGRGTATYDGLSIAWAVVESLCHDTKCRGLFATHYHELTQLALTLMMLKCFTMRIQEWGGRVVFLHEVIPGAADKSYGIHVASLAGLPDAVVRRATEILGQLEQKEKPAVTVSSVSVPTVTVSSAPAISGLEKKLHALDIDSLSAREALDVLYQLKSDCKILERPQYISA